jgi:hypothetical protein
MYFVLGTLVAGLLALTVTPGIWRRANRLSFARIEAAMPMSLAEIHAEKDQLRAEFAISTRRLEMEVSRLGEREVAHVIDMNLKREEIARLRAAEAARAEMARQREEGIAGEARVTEEKLNKARAELAERNQRIGERGVTIASLEAELAAAALLGEEQKLELVARDTEIGNLRDEVSASTATRSALVNARHELAAALAEEKMRLIQERHRGEGLMARMAALEAERADRLALLDQRNAELKEREAELAHERSQSEALQTEIARLEAERSDRLAELARYSAHINRLTGELAKAAAERCLLEKRVASVSASVADSKAEAVRPMIEAHVHLMTSGDSTLEPIAALGAEEAELAAREAEKARAAAREAEKAELATREAVYDRFRYSIAYEYQNVT